MDYSQIVEIAKEKLQQLMAKREALDREILAVSKIIEGAQLGAQSPSEFNPDDPNFSNIVAPESPEPAKFADKVRMILQKSTVPLFPTEIRERLESIGVEATSPKHLLIHVHKVLGRLLENDEVEQVTRDEKTAYVAISSFRQAFRSFERESMVRAAFVNTALAPPISDGDKWETIMKGISGLADARPPQKEESMGERMVRIAKQKRDELKRK